MKNAIKLNELYLASRYVNIIVRHFDESSYAFIESLDKAIKSKSRVEVRYVFDGKPSKNSPQISNAVNISHEVVDDGVMALSKAIISFQHADAMVKEHSGKMAFNVNSQECRIKSSLFGEFSGIDDFAALLLLIIENASLRSAVDDSVYECDFLVDGPFDSSYSLAIVNRNLASGLANSGYKVKLSDPELQKRLPDTDILGVEGIKFHGIDTADRTKAKYMLRNNYPPIVRDMNGTFNILANYAWEESAFPADWIQEFNNELNGVTVVSELVHDLLRNNGLKIPMAIVGNGVDHFNNTDASSKYADKVGKKFTFLHISSFFPRKGPDILLDAWVKAFSHSDNVSLIIKTFPNPHHDIESLIVEYGRRHPGMAEVVIINEDCSAADLIGLYERCNAFVAPSRAEGFGMPFAEAMLYKLPVITTAFGGQADFCNHDTAWLVDYKFSYADTHLNLHDSVWVEPDVNSLVDSMKEVYYCTPAEIKNKVEKAYSLVMQKYGWQAVSERTASFLTTLEKLPAVSENPRVGWISTYNVKCGIATYSQNLVCQFPKNSLAVLANKEKSLVQADENYVYRSIAWHANIVDDVLKEAASRKLNAIVIQHNHAFMSLDELGVLCERLSSLGIITILTLHNTHNPLSGSSFELQSKKLACADRVLVHTVADMNRLKDYGIVKNVALFPHGVYQNDQKSDLQKLRDQLGLNEKRIISSFGFAMPHKGIKELITAFSKLYENDKSLHLLLVNAEFPDQKSRQEVSDCRELIYDLNIESGVTFESNFLSNDDSIALLSLSDMVVYPYQFTQESASGAVRMGISARVPVLVTPLEIFSDLGSAVHKARGSSPDDLAYSINELLERIAKNGKNDVIANAEKWRAAHEWDILSRRLWGMIEGLCIDKK